MKQNFHFSIFFLAILLLVPIQVNAERPVHFSTMVHYDAINSYWPGYDLTLLFKGNWGIRYSKVENIEFLKTTETEDNTIIIDELSGNIELPFLIKTIDYKRFGEGPQKIFDFLTAYFGIGYNEYDLKLHQESYSPQSNNLVKAEDKGSVKTSITALNVGLYGGESFIFIDFRVQYLKGTTLESRLLDNSKEFTAWMLIFAIGIGY